MEEVHNRSAPFVGEEGEGLAFDLRVAEPDMVEPAGPLEGGREPSEAADGLQRAMAALQAELDEASRLDALFSEPFEALPEVEDVVPARPDPALWPQLVQDLHDTLMRKDAEISALREARDEALGTARRLEAKVACLQHRIHSEAAIRRYREAGEAGLTAA